LPDSLMSSALRPCAAARSASSEVADVFCIASMCCCTLCFFRVRCRVRRVVFHLRLPGLYIVRFDFLAFGPRIFPCTLRLFHLLVNYLAFSCLSMLLRMGGCHFSCALLSFAVLATGLFAVPTSWCREVDPGLSADISTSGNSRQGLEE
ncbi:hypothetical protein BJ546DRAFT_964081, partial [Cryomyces antarcticus]